MYPEGTMLTMEHLKNAWVRLTEDTNPLMQPCLLSWEIVGELVARSMQYNELMKLPLYKRLWYVLVKKDLRD